MRRRRLGLALAPALAWLFLSSHAFAAETDIRGWNGLTWGMTAQQVDAALREYRQCLLAVLGDMVGIAEAIELAVDSLLQHDRFLARHPEFFIKATTVADVDRARLAAEADRLRTALLTSISHDLKTPLASIMGAAGTLRDYAKTLSDPDRTELVSTVLDETYKIAITRFDRRIRVGGMAELRGFDLQLNPRRRETLELCLGDLFPGGGYPGKSNFWTGLRPMTPDGTPLVGRTPVPNLYLNTGHGTLGWTMACGSGKVLADIISGKSPDIDVGGLDISRYG